MFIASKGDSWELIGPAFIAEPRLASTPQDLANFRVYVRKPSVTVSATTKNMALLSQNRSGGGALLERDPGKESVNGDEARSGFSLVALPSLGPPEALQSSGLLDLATPRPGSLSSALVHSLLFRVLG